MELTADVSVIILLLGFTGLLAGYFFYFRPLFLHSAKPAVMDGSIVSQAALSSSFSGLFRLYWVRRKTPGRRSGRKLSNGEEDSLLFHEGYCYS